MINYIRRCVTKPPGIACMLSLDAYLAFPFGAADQRMQGLGYQSNKVLELCSKGANKNRIRLFRCTV